MNRNDAWHLLNALVTTPHIITHSLAVEAVMESLAKRFAPEEQSLWGITGLLHDLDNDLVDWASDMSLHGPKTISVLKDYHFGNESMYSAILAHNAATGVVPTTLIEKALYAADPITGFIRAVALVYPDKKLTSVKAKSVVKRMPEKRFAAGADRDAMLSIESLGLTFPEFVDLALDAMLPIAEEIGL